MTNIINFNEERLKRIDHPTVNLVNSWLYYRENLLAKDVKQFTLALVIALIVFEPYTLYRIFDVLNSISPILK